MNIRERASYAWGRICSLFKKKKQETEVKIEEQQENVPAEKTMQTAVLLSDVSVEPIKSERHDEETVQDINEESTDVDLSPDDIEVEIYEETEELTSDISSEKSIPYEPVSASKDSLPAMEDPIPSRMTDEYINWMKAQREADDAAAANKCLPFDTEK